MEMIKSESIVDVKANINLSNPEVQVNIDRARASDLGVRVSDIAGAVRLLMSGEDQISTYKEGAEQYPVTVRLMPGQRDDPAALSRLLVPSAKLGLIRLDSVAHLERGFGPSRIDRFNRQFTVGVYGNVAPEHSLSDAAADTQAIIDKMSFPPGYSMRFSGQVKILDETTTNMMLAIGLASIFMYMVLAAQFESLIHPLIIMLTLPLSIPFALISLIATGRSLNLFSALGVLLLLGIVKKNGILQIDYMNRLRELGQAFARGDPGSQPRALAADSDDHAFDYCGPDSDCDRHRRRRVATLGDCGDDHWRPDAVPGADAAGGAGRLFAGGGYARAGYAAASGVDRIAG